MTARVGVATKMIEQALTALRRQLFKVMTTEEAHGALGPLLILHGIDFAKRAGVPEAEVKRWCEECTANLFGRGVDIEGRREPS